jgi:hypothetical protein
MNTPPVSIWPILNTSIMESHVRICHVPALIEAGLAYEDYAEEYLLYGPIKGLRRRGTI